MFIFCSGCTQPGLVKKAHACLGTIVEITVADKDKPRAAINEAIEEAFAEIRRVEDLLSRFKSDSDISRINADAHKRVTKVSLETISLLEKAILFSQLSDGAFDITVYPLMEIWGFTGNGSKYIPQPEQITEVLHSVGYQHIDIIKQEQSVFLGRQGMSLDLGGLAKGYAVDRAIAVLKQKGIKNVLVAAGGDIYALGVRRKSRKWLVAVQHPRKKNAVLTTLELQDEAVATSGDYQKYIEIKGKRYSHIINPEIGFPCDDVPASATVLAKDCLSADALATAIFVLGPEKGIDLVDCLENTEAIVASSWEDDTLDILLSRGLKGRLKFNP